MAQNSIACGDVLPVVAGAAITSGTPVLVGDLLGVPLASAAIGETVSVAVEGVFSIAKRTHASTAAITQGSKVYWDAGNSRIDNTDNSAANKHIGWAYTAAISTAATVEVRLLG
jgi:predicted RecA/RadA family phage recombinase